MIDNYKKIGEYLHARWADGEFYMIELIQRRKDFPDGADVRAQTCVGTFYVSDPLAYERLEEEIKVRCRLHNARAYINLNRKSFRQTTCILAEQLFGMLQAEDCHKLPSRMASAAGLCKPAKESRVFLVDIDTRDVAARDIVAKLIGQWDRRGQAGMLTLPTVSGWHIITRPFAVQWFYDRLKELVSGYGGLVEIKHNSPTLLYYGGQTDR